MGTADKILIPIWGRRVHLNENRKLNLNFLTPKNFDVIFNGTHFKKKSYVHKSRICSIMRMETFKIQK